MTKKIKKQIITIAVGLGILLVAIILPKILDLPDNVALILYVAAYIIIGRSVIKKMCQNIVNGQIFDENLLMCVATLGAFLVGENAEAVAVMLFFQIGEVFENIAVNKSRKSIGALMDIRPEYARVKIGGSWTEISPEQVSIGSLIRVDPGERIPLDGIIREGSGTLDMSGLTGESIPTDVKVSDQVLSGSVNGSGVLTIEVTKTYGESTVSRILELVENASSRKSPTENFITRFAKYYTPIVCGLALLISVIPPLLTSQWSAWIYRGLTFLVVSCPCALVISIPLSFFAGLGASSAKGILVKGSNYLEALARTEICVFDKTGTLTKGVFTVCDIKPQPGYTENQLLAYGAWAESHSSHPISHSLRSAWMNANPNPSQDTQLEHTAHSFLNAATDASPNSSQDTRPNSSPNIIDVDKITSIREFSGEGVTASVLIEKYSPSYVKVYAGNRKLMERYGIAATEDTPPGTIVHIALDGIYAGYILIRDIIKPETPEALKKLRSLGVKETIMLTGDANAAAAVIAKEAGITSYHAGCLPEDKVRILQEIMYGRAHANDVAGRRPSRQSSKNDRLQPSRQSSKADGRQPSGSDRNRPTVAFIGDGMNDAPVLMTADVGIAMGVSGSDAAIEAADVVIMDDNLNRLSLGMKIARCTGRIVRQNIVFTLGIKIAVLIFAAIGIANMWWAVFADVGVMVLAVLNAVRILKMKF